VTPVKVVDASALGALLFGEPEAEAVAERLGDARLVAPSLLGFELTNVCLKKSRRHPEQRSSLTGRSAYAPGSQWKKSPWTTTALWNWLRRPV
jgi:uncharacterized protein with PIN domain